MQAKQLTTGRPCKDEDTLFQIEDTLEFPVIPLDIKYKIIPLRIE